MKLFIILVFFSQTAFAAEIVTRWTDADGRVHYGDRAPADDVESQTRLVIEDTYDEASYQAASRRYELYEQELKAREKQRRKLEKEARRAGRKPPLTDADNYELYMERQERMEREELQRKRERRAAVRRKWKMDCHDPANAGKIACR
jgi:hypothetical protein